MASSEEIDESAIQASRSPNQVPPPNEISLSEELRHSDGRVLLDKMAAARDPVSDTMAMPWHAVALLRFYNGNLLKGRATGFFINNDVVVTARHNLEVMADFDSIGIVAGYDALDNPGREISMLAQARYSHRDVAVLITSPQAVEPLELGEGVPEVCTLAGYAFFSDAGNPDLTYGTNAPSKIQRSLEYVIPCRQGDSGAPVFGGETSDGVVNAIHVEGRTDLDNGIIGTAEHVDQQMRKLIPILERHARSTLTGES